MLPRTLPPYARLLFNQGGLKATRPTGKTDPNPEVPPAPGAVLALHWGRSLALVGVILDLPGRLPRTETTEVVVMAIAPRLVRSPSQPLLTKAERRNNSRWIPLPLINYYVINRIFLLSGLWILLAVFDGRSPYEFLLVLWLSDTCHVSRSQNLPVLSVKTASILYAYVTQIKFDFCMGLLIQSSSI